jgi:DNA-binding CsgD family transcriptional regulator
MKKRLWRDGIVLPRAPDVGLVLMDMSYKPIAWDRGAAAILNGGTARIEPEAPSSLPKEVLDMIGNRKPHELPSEKVSIRMGNNNYSCRAHVMEPEQGFSAMVVLHMERVFSVTDAVCAVAAKCNLTRREQEALKGLSMGMCSKELAQTMNISPNTVKVFLHLIMIKMGVTNRGGIVAQLLQHLQHLQHLPEEPGRARAASSH